MANTYLTRTPSSTTNRKTFTISTWIKRSELSTNQKIFEASPDGSNRAEITFKTTDIIFCHNYFVSESNVMLCILYYLLDRGFRSQRINTVQTISCSLDPSFTIPCPLGTHFLLERCNTVSLD